MNTVLFHQGYPGKSVCAPDGKKWGGAGRVVGVVVEGVFRVTGTLNVQKTLHSSAMKNTPFSAARGHRKFSGLRTIEQHAKMPCNDLGTRFCGNSLKVFWNTVFHLQKQIFDKKYKKPIRRVYHDFSRMHFWNVKNVILFSERSRSKFEWLGWVLWVGGHGGVFHAETWGRGGIGAVFISREDAKKRTTLLQSATI